MKKISTAMAEAGVNAMARIQRTRQTDIAVVAAVYNAMESVRENEERAMLHGPQSAKPYVHQDYPQWFCNGDQRRIFNSPEDVEEGWTPVMGATAMSIAEPINPPPAAKRGPGRPPKHVE